MSALRKKNALSLMIGPPRLPAYWYCLKSVR
jgi:hypothetical protein